MAEVRALVIAVEHYQSSTISPVAHAEADASAFADSLVGLGVTVDNGDVLLSRDATKTTIESRIRRLGQGAGPEDTLFLFYAGHGFSRADINYITCYDSQPGDWVRTSIPLQHVFSELRKSAATRVAIFLDACESGLPADAAARSLIQHLRPEELDEFLRDAEYTVCFASCKADQSSYSSHNLKHGIWTYHVLEALRGNAPTALERGRYVTADSLQNYLSEEVPRTVRHTFTGKYAQTPWVYGGRTRDFLLADLSEVLARRAATSQQAVSIREVGLHGTKPISVKMLSGFDKRRHFVSDTATSAAESFAVRVAQNDLQKEIDDVFRALKDGFRYKRKDVMTAIDDGRASVLTPDFEFNVTVTLDSDDPTQVMWSRELTNIANPGAVMTEAFDSAFEGMFDTVQTSFSERLNIAEVVDRLEEMEPEGVSLEYPADLTYCVIRFEGSRGSVRITEAGLSYEVGYEKQPTRLIQSFVELGPRLALLPTVKGLLPRPGN